MKVIDLLHRWTGGLIGLLLVLIGLTGAILVHRHAWIGIAHAHDAPLEATAPVAAAVERMMADPTMRPRSITFAGGDFGLHELSYDKGAGAYADRSGAIVVRWADRCERPELCLFDIHHQLLSGDIGERMVGVAALIGLMFVITGIILWWGTRRTFHLRLLPGRLSRPAILRYHRDLGIVVAPLIALSLITGALLVFRPLTALTFGPGAPATIAAALKPPKAPARQVADRLDWRGLIVQARSIFPKAQFGALILPPAKGGLITLRMRQPDEWLPKGRTTLWFAADSGRLIGARDSTGLPLASRAFNMVYPIHAAEVGGLAYRLLITVSGLALTTLGSLTVWTFWARRIPTPVRESGPERSANRKRSRDDPYSHRRDQRDER